METVFISLINMSNKYLMRLVEFLIYNTGISG